MSEVKRKYKYSIATPDVLNLNRNIYSCCSLLFRN